MEITKTLSNGSYDVAFNGRFTFTDNPAFREVLECIAQPDVKQVVFYMGHATFIDSAALGMLLLAHDEAKKHGKAVVIRGAAGQVKKMFDLARFDQYFSIE